MRAWHRRRCACDGSHERYCACVSDLSCIVDVRFSCGLYPMVAVGEGYCRRFRSAKVFASALCSGSRVQDCDRRAGVVTMDVVYSQTYRLTYFHRRRGVCVGDGRECVGSAMLKSKINFRCSKSDGFQVGRRALRDLGSGPSVTPASASRALSRIGIRYERFSTTKQMIRETGISSWLAHFNSSGD